MPLNGNITVNGGTSNITLSSTAASIGQGISGSSGSNFVGGTFYNVTFSSNAATLLSIYGANTFNNLTFTTPAAAIITNVLIAGNQTVSGTLTVAGADGAKRYFLRSNEPGTERTLTVATVAALTDVDFRDIKAAGASSPWSGTRLGDCKGNTNITFVAGANKYIATATGSSNWSANIWATASGGSAATANFPLAQDTVIIDNAGMNTSATLTIDFFYNIGVFDVSSRTNAITLAAASGAGSTFYGDVTLSTAVTSSLSLRAFNYAKRATQSLTTNGINPGGITVISPNGTLQLADNYSSASANISVLIGTFDANNKNITCSQITTNNTITNLSKTLTLGSGTITTTSGVGTATAISNLTVSSTTATITSSGNATYGFNGITATINGSITVNGAASTCDIYGTTTFANLTLTSSTTTGFVNKLLLYGDLTITGTLALAGGTSVTQRNQVRSGNLGIQRTLSAATVTGLTDVDFRDINATGAGNWASGTRLGDGGGNAGITFPAPKTVYWNLAGTQNWSATGWAPGTGGTPAVNNFPLAQDTAVFDDAGAAGTVTFNTTWNIGTIDASGRTVAITFSGTGAPNIHGDVKLGSGVTASNTGAYTIIGRGSQTYITAGKSLSHNLLIEKMAGTFSHGDAYTSSGSLSVNRGTYTTANYNVTCSGINSSNSNTRSVTFGTSSMTFTGTNAIIFTNSANLTFNGSNSTVTLSSGLTYVSGGDQRFGSITKTTGTGNTFLLQSGIKATTLANTSSSYADLGIVAGAIVEVENFNYTGASGNVVLMYGDYNFSTTKAVLKIPSNKIGANSVDGGNNIGLSFTGTSPNYLYVTTIEYSLLSLPGGRFLQFFN